MPGVANLLLAQPDELVTVDRYPRDFVSDADAWHSPFLEATVYF